MSGRVVARYERRTETIVGTELELTRLVRSLDARGRLIHVVPAPRPLADGRSAIKVVGLFPPRVVAPVTWWRTRWARRTAIAAGVAAALAGAFWCVTLLVGAALNAVGRLAPRVLPYAALAGSLLIVWAVRSAARGHACRGLHCAGCRG